MPVLWSVSHSTRLVSITVQGTSSLADMIECVGGIMTPATLSYRKLVDLTEGSPILSREDILALAARVDEHVGQNPLGVLAVVAVSRESERQARLFASLSASDRPCRIFRDVSSAHAWLEAHPWRAPQLWFEADGPEAAAAT